MVRKGDGVTRLKTTREKTSVNIRWPASLSYRLVRRALALYFSAQRMQLRKDRSLDVDRTIVSLERDRGATEGRSDIPQSKEVRFSISGSARNLFSRQNERHKYPYRLR